MKIKNYVRMLLLTAISLSFLMASHVKISSAQTNTESLFKKGIDSIRTRDYDVSISVFSQLIHRNPRNPSLYINRGVAKYHKQDFTGALKDYDKALGLVGYLRRNGQANSLLIKSLLMLIYLNRGAAYFEIGKFNAAKQDLDSAISLNLSILSSGIEPDSADLLAQLSFAYSNRGDVNRALDRPDEAIQDYTKAIENNPYNTHAYLNRATIRYEQKLYEEALKDIQEAIDRAIPSNNNNEELANAYEKRGAIYFSMGNLVDSLESLNESIRLSSNCAVCFYNRGLTHYRMGNKEFAMRDFSKAAELYKKQGMLRQYEKVMTIINKLGLYE